MLLAWMMKMKEKFHVHPVILWASVLSRRAQYYRARTGLAHCHITPGEKGRKTIGSLCTSPLLPSAAKTIFPVPTPLLTITTASMSSDMDSGLSSAPESPSSTPRRRQSDRVRQGEASNVTLLTIATQRFGAAGVTPPPSPMKRSVKNTAKRKRKAEVGIEARKLAKTAAVRSERSHRRDEAQWTGDDQAGQNDDDEVDKEDDDRMRDAKPVKIFDLSHSNLGAAVPPVPQRCLEIFPGKPVGPSILTSPFDPDDIIPRYLSSTNRPLFAASSFDHNRWWGGPKSSSDLCTITPPFAARSLRFLDIYGLHRIPAVYDDSYITWLQRRYRSVANGSDSVINHFGTGFSATLNDPSPTVYSGEDRCERCKKEGLTFCYRTRSKLSSSPVACTVCQVYGAQKACTIDNTAAVESRDLRSRVEASVVKLVADMTRSLASLRRNLEIQNVPEDAQAAIVNQQFEEMLAHLSSFAENLGYPLDRDKVRESADKVRTTREAMSLFQTAFAPVANAGPSTGAPAIEAPAE